MSALTTFNDNLKRADDLYTHARSSLTPALTTELRDDILRAAWMFAVGAFDSYCCDAYTEVLAAVLISKQRNPSLALSKHVTALEVPIGTVFAPYKARPNWKWRMMARNEMERQNVLSLETVANLFNPFLAGNFKLWPSVVDSWVQLPGANRRLFGKPAAKIDHELKTLAAAIAIPATTADQKKQRKEDEQSAKQIRDAAAGHLKTRFKAIMQRRHDCIHNCDRPKVAIRGMNGVGTTRNAIKDIEFLVTNLDKLIRAQIRHLLQTGGCTKSQIQQVGF